MERILSTMEEVRIDASPFFPRVLLDAKYGIETLSFVTIQIDKILAFSVSPAHDNQPKNDPF